MARSSLSLALLAASFSAACPLVASAQDGPPVVAEVRGPRLDVVFVIDATGSMGDEIEQVKEHLRSTARSITAATPRPDVRFGIVVYRDTSDAEHVRVVPLTRNVDAIHQQLAGLEAIGGGDTPEDVDAGLSLAVHEMEWASDAAHLVFLIGDAAPQSYGVDRERLLADARAREIRIHTVQASGMDRLGAEYFRHWASATGGVAELLTYRQQVAAADGTRTVFHRGGETYLSRRSLSPAEAELSFSDLESRGLVARDDSYAAPSLEGGADGAASGGHGRAGRGRGSARSVAAAPMAASPAPSDSDIGGIVAREARRAAEARGAAY